MSDEQRLNSLDRFRKQPGHIDLVPGRHVAALALEDVSLSGGLLLFAATHEPGEFQREPPFEVVEPAVRVLSAGDDTWKCTLAQPTGDWKSLSFDDSGWPALVEVTVLQPAGQDHGSWQFRRCAERGALALGLPSATPAAATGSVWVRKVFDIPPAGLAVVAAVDAGGLSAENGPGSCSSSIPHPHPKPSGTRPN